MKALELGLVVLGLVMAVLGITYTTYDYNVRWAAQQKELASTCLSGGGTWIYLYGRPMCINSRR